MPAQIPDLLALDFDGVICNGLVEYFRTTCRTYCKIWDEDSQHPIQDVAQSFYALRPVIETGWEMPVLLRAIITGIPESKIWQYWSEISQQIVAQEKLDVRDVAAKLDGVRDEWIQKDLAGWLQLHEFYPGVVAKLRSLLTQSSPQLYIITTKEGRFVKQLLQQQGIELSPEAIIGKEAKKPKYKTIHNLLALWGEDTNIWFVEDRLPALQLVEKQPDLGQVKLYLANWGYNTHRDRDIATHDPRIGLLSLQQFQQDFAAW